MIELERASLIATPIANLGIGQALAAGVKKPQASWYNPFPRLIRAIQLQQQLDRDIVQLALKLAQDGTLPGWAAIELELDLLKLVNSLY